MTLSPEEKQRIYEEEKARKEAQERLKQEEATAKKEVDKKNAKKVGIGCLSIIAVLLVIGMISTLWTKLHPHVDTPEEQAFKTCVANWMDVRVVGEFALPQTVSGFAEAGKRCEQQAKAKAKR